MFVSLQEDNPFGDRRRERPLWEAFIECIPYYDLNFVKREIDVADYKLHGAREVAIFVHGYFGPIFHPIESSPLAQGEHQTVFVGTAIDHRVRYVHRLIRKEQIPLQVFGNKWNRTAIYYIERQHFHAALNHIDYVNTIHKSNICLGFVSSSNHDEYTHRSFEIPASGGFLLAERTRKHLEMYREGEEAEFFGSVEECADKIRFYLSNESSRLKIAYAGRLRCEKAKYGLEHTMADAIGIICSYM
jgi:spore maturation protein CgeB